MKLPFGHFSVTLSDDAPPIVTAMVSDKWNAAALEMLLDFNKEIDDDSYWPDF